MKAFTTLVCGALVLLAAALLVPQALGAVRPDDRAGMLGAGAVVATQSVRPDDRAGPLGTGAAVTPADQSYYWQGERDYGLHTPGGDIVAPAVVPRVETPSGWAWNDAWFGVMAVVGVALVAAAIMVTMHEHRGHLPIPH